MTSYRIMEYEDGNGKPVFQLQYSWKLFGLLTLWLDITERKWCGGRTRCVVIEYPSLESAQAALDVLIRDRRSVDRCMVAIHEAGGTDA